MEDAESVRVVCSATPTEDEECLPSLEVVN